MQFDLASAGMDFAGWAYLQDTYNGYRGTILDEGELTDREESGCIEGAGCTTPCHLGAGVLGELSCDSWGRGNLWSGLLHLPCRGN